MVPKECRFNQSEIVYCSAYVVVHGCLLTTTRDDKLIQSNRYIPVEGKSSVCLICMKYRIITLIIIIITKRQESRIEVNEMRMLRWMCGVIRKDKIRNEHIRGTTKVAQASRKITERRLKWYGHVMRMEEDHVVKRVMTKAIPGKRKRGRPKTRSLSKGKDVVVCLPGARIEHVTERVKKIMGRGNGGSIVVHVGTNNADKEGTTAILEKYRDLLKKTKQARVGQIIISGILPVFGNKIQGYRNSKRMAVNGMVERLCKEEDVGYMDLWDSFVGNEDMYVRDGLHLSGKGAAVFAEGLSGAVASGLGKVRYLN